MKIKQTLRKIVFGTKKEKIKCDDYKFFIQPPPPKEVAKIIEMLKQVETWINSGEKELAEKHWMLIAEECHKYGTQQLKTKQNGKESL